MSTTTYAVLVEYALPEGVDFDTAAGPLLAALRELSPCTPTLVTATTGPDAELLVTARATANLMPQADRLHLDPDDVVVITVPAKLAPDDYRHIADAASVAFPKHQTVLVWEGTTVSARPAREVTP
ncbi:hypothetical protein [Amycolatopsis solani]|uniref:hypothetical protein n=1 Tax=Amycolatopsis solani TaxID=3028615 RepID=UPI0025AF78C3|nr:hypothetical protein [Amycolatopsis sp. MEP2-6]